MIKADSAFIRSHRNETERGGECERKTSIRFAAGVGIVRGGISVTIPNSVTTIGESAFSLCSSLKSIYFIGNAPAFDSSIFYQVTTTAYYPEELADVTLPPRAPDVTAALTADGVLTVTGALSENAATTNTVFLAVYQNGRLLCVKDISGLAQNELRFVCGDMQGADTVKPFRLGNGLEPRFAVCAIKIS